jgi:hypothetical protein
MVIPIGIIFALIPETPWWLASKGKLDESRNVLQICNGGIEGYDIQEQIVRIPFGLLPQLNAHCLLVGRYADSMTGSYDRYC